MDSFVKPHAILMLIVQVISENSDQPVQLKSLARALPVRIHYLWSLCISIRTGLSDRRVACVVTSALFLYCFLMPHKKYTWLKWVKEHRQTAQNQVRRRRTQVLHCLLTELNIRIFKIWTKLKLAFSYVTRGILWKNMQELWYLYMTRRLNMLYKWI